MEVKMIGLSIKEFIKTLKNIVVSSPSSILFVIAGFIFLIAMVINIKKKKSIGKTLYLIGWIFIVTFLITKYNSYLTTLLDNLINNVFMQILFPNLATYVIIIILSNIIYIKSALKKDKKNYEKIINTLFFIIIMFGMNYILEEIISDKVNIYDIDLYSNQKILVLVQSTTIVFVAWQIFLISKKIIKKLINISNNKVSKETTKKDDKIQEIKPKTINDDTNLHIDIAQNVNEMENNNGKLDISSTSLKDKTVNSVSQTSNNNDIFNNQKIISNPADNVPTNNQIPTTQKIPMPSTIQTSNSNESVNQIPTIQNIQLQNTIQNNNNTINNQSTPKRNIVTIPNTTINNQIPEVKTIPTPSTIPTTNNNIVLNKPIQTVQSIPLQNSISTPNNNAILNNQKPNVQSTPKRNIITPPNKVINNQIPTFQNSLTQNTIPAPTNNTVTNNQNTVNNTIKQPSLMPNPNIFNQKPK